MLTSLCPHLAFESVVVVPTHGRFEECVRCTQCHSPRCGNARSENPCTLIRHHTTHHMYLNGTIAPIGGVLCSVKGCSCAGAVRPPKVAHRR